MTLLLLLGGCLFSTASYDDKVAQLSCADGSAPAEGRIDADGDGYGAGDPVLACPEDGRVTPDLVDCDDADPAISPGALEVCNGIDDDCDGTPDDGVAQTLFVDEDGDGYGTTETLACPGSGFATLGGDCDDEDANRRPDAAEVCNGVDDNCNDVADEGLPTLLWYVDHDEDGFGAGQATPLCGTPAGFATNDDDCDDADSGVTVEVSGFVDSDGDNFAGTPSTDCPANLDSLTQDDCDDEDVSINPAAPDSIGLPDSDCDGDIAECDTAAVLLPGADIQATVSAFELDCPMSRIVLTPSPTRYIGAVVASKPVDLSCDAYTPGVDNACAVSSSNDIDGRLLTLDLRDGGTITGVDVIEGSAVGADAGCLVTAGPLTANGLHIEACNGTGLAITDGVLGSVLTDYESMHATRVGTSSDLTVRDSTFQSAPLLVAEANTSLAIQNLDVSVASRISNVVVDAEAGAVVTIDGLTVSAVNSGVSNTPLIVGNGADISVTHSDFVGISGVEGGLARIDGGSFSLSTTTLDDVGGDCDGPMLPCLGLLPRGAAVYARDAAIDLSEVSITGANAHQGVIFAEDSDVSLSQVQISQTSVFALGDLVLTTPGRGGVLNTVGSTLTAEGLTIDVVSGQGSALAIYAEDTEVSLASTMVSSIVEDSTEAPLTFVQSSLPVAVDDVVLSDLSNTGEGPGALYQSGATADLVDLEVSGCEGSVSVVELEGVVTSATRLHSHDNTGESIVLATGGVLSMENALFYGDSAVFLVTGAAQPNDSVAIDISQSTFLPLYDAVRLFAANASVTVDRSIVVGGNAAIELDGSGQAATVTQSIAWQVSTPIFAPNGTVMGNFIELDPALDPQTCPPHEPMFVGAAEGAHRGPEAFDGTCP